MEHHGVREKLMIPESPRMGFNLSIKQCVNGRLRSCTTASRPEPSPREEEMWGRQPQCFGSAKSVSFEKVHSSVSHVDSHIDPYARRAKWR